MKSTILAAAMAVAALASIPALAGAAQPPHIKVQFSPGPPRQGTETMTIVLTDGSGKPVNGAKVSVATSMPTMSMSGPTVSAKPKGSGRYVATVSLAFATRWGFTVQARANGTVAKRTILLDVAPSR